MTMAGRDVVDDADKTKPSESWPDNDAPKCGKRTSDGDDGSVLALTASKGRPGTSPASIPSHLLLVALLTAVTVMAYAILACPWDFADRSTANAQMTTTPDPDPAGLQPRRPPLSVPNVSGITVIGPGPLHTTSRIKHLLYQKLGLGYFHFEVNTTTHVLSRTYIGVEEAQNSLANDYQYQDVSYDELALSALRAAIDDPSAGEPQLYDVDDYDRDGDHVRFLTAPVAVTAPFPGVPGWLTWSKIHMFALEYGTGRLLQATFLPFKATELQPGMILTGVSDWTRPWKHNTEGNWGWTPVSEQRFMWQPTVTFWQFRLRDELHHADCVDVWGVTSTGILLQKTYLDLETGIRQWLPEVNHGQGFVGQVGIAFNWCIQYLQRGRDEIQVVAIKDGQYQHTVGQHGPLKWHAWWTPLGVPDECAYLAPDQLGFPVVLDWGCLRLWSSVADGSGTAYETSTNGPAGIDSERAILSLRVFDMQGRD